MIEVSTYYAFDGDFRLDEVAIEAAQREPDSSGAGCGERDLSWTCKSKVEAMRIKRALDKVGMHADVMEF